MFNTHQAIVRLAYLINDINELHLQPYEEAPKLAQDILDFINEFTLLLPPEPSVQDALSDADAALGRLDEYIDTPEGPEARTHLEAAAGRLQDAIDALSKLP